MKKTLFLAIITAFLACNSTENKPNSEVPKALQPSNQTSVYTKYRSNTSIVEELFQEKMKNDSSLQTLDKSIAQIEDAYRSEKAIFTDYNSKNSQFNYDAQMLLQPFKNKALQSSVNESILKSSNYYQNLIHNVQTQFNQLDSNHVSLSEYYTAYKIAIALQMVEEFQKTQKPSTKKALSIHQLQQKRIEQLKKKLNQ